MYKVAVLMILLFIISCGVSMVRPSGFVVYEDDYDDSDISFVSVEGVKCILTHEDNYEGGDISFWESAIKRTLTNYKAYSLLRAFDISADGYDGRCMIFSKTIKGKKYKYLIAIFIVPSHFLFFRTGEDIYRVEFAAPVDLFDGYYEKIIKSIKDIDF